MRIRFPSLSFDSSQSRFQPQPNNIQLTDPITSNGESSKLPGPSHRKQRRKDDNTKRCRSTIGRSKRKEINMARKKEKIKKQLKARGLFIFVGNFEPTVDERVLHSAFIHCGKITRIQIRCSRGGAVTIGRPVPAHIRTSRDLQHASIEFATHEAVTKALLLNGFSLHGRQVVVSDVATDLPELGKHHGRRVGVNRQPQFSTRESDRLAKMRTEFLSRGDSPSTPITDKHLLMGISFAKCLM